MPELPAGEHRALPADWLHQCGEGVVRMLERVGGETRQGLDLGQRPQPGGDPVAVATAPRVDRVGELGSPEQQQAEGGEDGVVHRVEQVDQTLQMPGASGAGDPVAALQPLRQFDQTAALERPALDDLEQR